MAPQYGEVRVDYITYTTGVSPNEANVTVPVSGLINDPTFSGNVIIEGDLTVSGSINASGVIISGVTGLFDDGTEAAPSIAFASDPDTGIYKPATNEIGISTNASEALRIDNIGKVGIGTSNPAYELDVVGDLRLKRSSTNDGAIYFGVTGAANNFIYGNSDADVIAFTTNGSESVRINSTGSVGIGTSAPAGQLTVLGTDVNSNTGRILNVDDDTTAARGVGGAIAFRADISSTQRVLGVVKGFLDNDNPAVFDGGLVFETRTNGEATTRERMRITRAGNVGIGTTDPQSLLHVASSANWNFPNATLQRITSNNANPAFLQFALGGDNGDVNVATEHAYIGLKLDSTPTATDTVNGLNAYMRFFAPAGVLIPNGNVGIGLVENPSQTLTVAGGNILLDPTKALRWGTNNAAYIGGNDSSSGSTGGYLTFGVNSERMRIDYEGNVGIGTSGFNNLGAVYSPALALKGATGSRLGLWGTGGRWWYAQTETSNKFILGTRISGNTIDKSLISVDTNYKVGIGTESPAATLDVKGAGRFELVNTDPTDNYKKAGSAIQMRGYGGQGILLGTNSSQQTYIQSSYLDADTSGNTKLLINPEGGNVGIWTSTPATTLDIFGDDQTDTNLDPADINVMIRSTAGQPNSGGTLGFGVSVREPFAAINSLFLNGNNNGIGDLAFNLRTSVGDTTLTESMRLKYNGRVGIGNTDPNAKLEIDNGVLGAVAGDELLTLRLTATAGSNFNQLSFLEQRLVNGTNWNNTESRIQRTVDSTDQGYIAFTTKRGSAGGVKDVAIGYGATEVLRVTNGERVGIMTSEPERVFDVKGNFLLGPADNSTEFQGQSLRNGKDSSAADTVSFIDFQNNLSTPDSHIFARHKTNGSSTLEFGTTSAGDRSTDRRAGLLYLVEANVGIANAAPLVTLDVNGIARTGILYVGVAQNGAGQTKLALINNDGGGNSNITFNDANQTAMQDGSCARITADVDSTTAALQFTVGDNSVANTTNTRSSVMVLKTNVVNVNKDINMGPSTGIKFNNGTSLDDYEEGTFTPTVQDATTYAVQNGYYTKVGNLVTFALRVQPGAGTPSATILTVGGLPFPCESIAGGPYGGAFRTLGTLVDDSVVSNLNWHIPVNQTLFRAYSGSSTINTNATGVNIVGNFIFHGFYYTDE